MAESEARQLNDTKLLRLIEEATVKLLTANATFLKDTQQEKVLESILKGAATRLAKFGATCPICKGSGITLSNQKSMRAPNNKTTSVAFPYHDAKTGKWYALNIVDADISHLYKVESVRRADRRK